MPYTDAEKKSALARMRRILGQSEALVRALEAEAECGAVLQQLAAIRGAVNGLMSEVLQSHIREVFAGAAPADPAAAQRVQDVTALVRRYLH